VVPGRPCRSGRPGVNVFLGTWSLFFGDRQGFS
jgi:hypothetical protein